MSNGIGRWLLALLLLGLLPKAGAAPKFTLFESGQVRPLALAHDRPWLYAVNTPDGRLEILNARSHSLAQIGSVPVGLEPVAVAVRNSHEVWVVNHLSDSVSIVDVSTNGHARVVRTLLVGDEPRDIVFAGPGRSRAFITTAHRGQNTGRNPQLTTPGVGRADVWVFDANDLGSAPGGQPIAVLTLFADTPRALAVTPDGRTVYAAAFHSGNRSTTLHEQLIPNGGAANGGLPGPLTNIQGIPRPETSMIVQFNGTHWIDTIGRVWDALLRFSLPDKDVFVIDAMSNPPAQVSSFASVGTILFNMIVNPRNGKVYVSNTDAQNLTRFEGPGGGGSTVRGHLHESRITVLKPQSGAVLPRHLNKHIDYSHCCNDVGEKQRSLAFPMGMAITQDGETLYVAAFGSSKIGVFDTDHLESDTFVPSAAHQIQVSGGGPSGMVLDDDSRRLFVMTRFDNGISVIDTSSGREVTHVALFNPEPASVVQGRPMLYDATRSSSHGDSACASCHVFADFDSLAWDLGNPDGLFEANPGPFRFLPPPQIFPPQLASFHPMKGPMTTQSLRGMSNHGPMHWRGDRTGGDEEPTAQPDSGSFNEVIAFKNFSPAFQGLLGNDHQPSDAQMQAFADFALQIVYPPNPIRNLDNSLTASQAGGRNFFFTRVSDTINTCNGCHRLDPTANADLGVARPGFFGTDGMSSFEFEAQVFKIPHLRNLYQKVGMFGMAPTQFFPGLPGVDPNMGPQVRGFGFIHDGSCDTVFRFHSAFVFLQSNTPLAPGFPPNTGGIPFGPLPDAQTGKTGFQIRRELEDFVMAFDSNMAPIVGQQVTLTATNAASVASRLALLTARADVGECDLIVKGRVWDRDNGFLYVPGSGFAGDRSADPIRSDASLRSLATSGRELTYTCVPPGSGGRMGIDRDGDGYLDGDEQDAGTNPADPNSHP